MQYYEENEADSCSYCNSDEKDKHNAGQKHISPSDIKMKNKNKNRNDSDLKNRNVNVMHVELSGNAVSKIWIKTEADSDLDSDLKSIIRGGDGGKARK